MTEADIQTLVRAAIDAAADELGISEVPERIEVVRPRQKEHGDFSTNVALELAARAGRPPREIADILLRHLPHADFLAKAEIAGPGFVNFTLVHGWLHRVLVDVERLGEAFGRAPEPVGERVQVEFVSANPTGPLHVGTGRGAVVGDALAALLEAAGYEVEREYYVNDAGTQAALFAASIEARYLERFGREGAVPEGGYEGPYVAELAAAIAEEHGESLLDQPETERRATLLREGIERSIEGIRATLERFGVRHDSWFHESTLHETGRIRQVVEALRERGLAYDEEGAVWFASSRFGDEKDRVLIRSTGDPTYFAADCAYLREKFARGFDRVVYVWGADHHGTVRRLLGAADALGYDPATIDFVLLQLVALYRAGEPVKMSKRTGDLVTLDELLDEVGTDAARYTLLTRSTDSSLDFDIEAVKRQALDNPVYYVQYAHARIASIFRHAEQRGVQMRPIDDVPLEVLEHDAELALLRKIAEWPEVVAVAANLRAPYRLTRYVEELAADFHRFYTECHVVTEDRDLTQARLHLARGSRRVIANVLRLLGVSAPESMERLADDG